jgi:hypothetical protein
MTDRKKPGVAFWATVVMVAVLVLYPLSFGPACWASSRSGSLEIRETCDRFYYPILWVWLHTPAPIDSAIEWYANVGAAVYLYLGEGADGRLTLVHVPDK